MSEIKLTIQTDIPKIELKTDKQIVSGGDVLTTPSVRFIATGSAGNKGDKGEPGTISDAYIAAIAANTAKISYPSSDSYKLSNIQAGAEVNVKANWNETNSNSDAFIENKPTIPVNTNTTYSVSCVDGENSDEEKIRLTDSSGSTDDVILEAGTGLSIARDGDKITFTNTVTDTDTVLTTEQVQDVVGAMFTSNTETRISAAYDDTDGTIDLVVDDMTADTNTQLTDEQVQDIVGAMVDGGTETNISVTYDDTSGKLNFVSTDTNTTYSEATSSDAGLMSTAHHDKLDGIETGATADQTQADINGLAITEVGTIDTGVWNGTAIASAYLDSDTAHLSIFQVFTAPKFFQAQITLDGDKDISPDSDGVTLHIDAQDLTDTSSSASSTNTTFNHVAIENPRVIATNSSVTTTNASTVYIKGAPVAGTNQTFTNSYALNVAAGTSYFGGAITANGGVTGDVTGNVSGSSGSCTGNAATATALTSGDKTISGTLKVSGNDILDEDDVVCIRFDSSGNTTIANGLSATLKTHKHFINFGVNLGYNYARWLPWGSYYIVEQTTDANPEYTTYVAPYDGKFIKLVIRSEESLADTTISIYKVGDGTEEPDQGSLVDTKTVDIASANTAYEYTFDSDATFSKGDAMSVKIQPTTDPVAAGVTGTFVLEFDLTT